VHDDLVLDELPPRRGPVPARQGGDPPGGAGDLLEQADFVTSTSKMVDLAEQHDELIIGTERGLIDRLKQRFPEKTLIPLSGAAICGNMKMNTLAKLAWSLDHMQHEVTLDEDVRSRAERRCAGCWSSPADGAPLPQRAPIPGALLLFGAPHRSPRLPHPPAFTARSRHYALR
jgi:hypothetical protein